MSHAARGMHCPPPPMQSGLWEECPGPAFDGMGSCGGGVVIGPGRHAKNRCGSQGALTAPDYDGSDGGDNGDSDSHGDGDEQPTTRTKDERTTNDEDDS